MDQCTHCTMRGNIAGCQATPCSIHESWYGQQIRQQRDDLLAALKVCARVLDDLGMSNTGAYEQAIDAISRASRLTEQGE